MYIKIKRIIDIILSIVLIIILSIPMLIIALAIKIQGKGKIIYKSKRIGKNLEPFYMYKFRSMTNEKQITKIGKIIRRTSLDELPQLFNIIKGEMSFIGPRPWISDYYEYLTEEQKRRNDVLPGITGLAQANGRNGISVLKKIEYDIQYVNNIDFMLDVKIILKTIKTIFTEKNVDITEQGIKKEIEELRREREKK